VVHSPPKPLCYLCVGKDCRRDVGYSELGTALGSIGKVKRVKCQDLCEGPVAGVEVDGRMEWFEGVRKARHREAVVALATGRSTEVPAELRGAWVRKRSGKVKR
jgi:hypothetical protein